MAKDGLTKVDNFAVKARELDFVTRFSKNWNALMQIMGIMRPIRKQAGTKLVAYKASVDLKDGAVGEGEEIPYSMASVEEIFYGDVDVEKYAKAVSLEAVNRYGAVVAIEKTDDQFLVELQNKVLTRFYKFLNNGALLSVHPTWQMALAMAKGNVVDKFNQMRRTVTEVVGFANVLDVYEYVGAAEITIQTQFGMTYVENFMGYSTLFLMSEPDIPRGTVIAVPVENIDLYYVDPSDSDFAKLGLVYTTAGETNLIGFHAEGDYKHAVGEMFALMGMTLWAEYIDGIAIAVVNDTTNMTGATVTTPTQSAYWGTNVTDMQSGITISGDKITGTLKYLKTGALVNDWGEGNFLAVKFTNFSSGVNYGDVKVGLVPTEGAGMQTLDSDQDGVFKITNKDIQKLAVVQTLNGKKFTQYFDLSGLTVEGAE